MSNISALSNIPDISFIDNMTLEETEQQLRELYLYNYKELTGKDTELPDADIKSLIIKAFALIEYQTMQYIEAKGRAEMLKTSTGDDLDNLAALFGVERLDSSRAVATERFFVSEKREEVTAIPAGTRVKTQNNIYFNTLTYAQIEAGEEYVDVAIQAEEAGTSGNGIYPGMINMMVDPIAYIAACENIDITAGGADVESDDDLTERLYLAPSQYSCAGPTDAYEYFVREWSSDVGDVMVTSDTPCVVQIYVIMKDGSLLTEAQKESLLEYVNGEKIRPLTDIVICEDPTEVYYDIDFTYWIASSDQKSVATIQEAVQKAADDFVTWQQTMGRDINPTELIARIREAGAKRVKLTSPDDIVIADTELPRCSSINITYGGLEND